MTTASANAIADALAALADGGFLRIYDGTQPATADTAITTQVLLVELTFGTPAFAAASGGVANANDIGSGVCAATGTATWFRVFRSNGTTVVFDGSVGVSGCDLNFTQGVSFVTGQGKPVSAFSITPRLA